jgi:hypothetical protein
MPPKKGKGAIRKAEQKQRSSATISKQPHYYPPTNSNSKAALAAKGMKALWVSVPVATHARLRDVARKADLPLAVVVRTLLERYLGPLEASLKNENSLNSAPKKLKAQRARGAADVRRHTYRQIAALGGTPRDKTGREVPPEEYEFRIKPKDE